MCFKYSISLRLTMLTDSSCPFYDVILNFNYPKFNCWCHTWLILIINYKSIFETIKRDSLKWPSRRDRGCNFNFNFSWHHSFMYFVHTWINRVIKDLQEIKEQKAKGVWEVQPGVRDWMAMNPLEKRVQKWVNLFQMTPDIYIFVIWQNSTFSNYHFYNI